MLDDRDISAGAIFSDNDLIGTPIQIIIGKKFLDGNEVEIKDRSTNEYIPVSSQSCMETVKNVINILKYTYLLNIYVQLDLNIICYKMEVAFVKRSLRCV